jgi:hypothetical protein
MGQLQAHGLVSKDTMFKCLMISFNHDRAEELLNLVTSMPPEDASHERGHKYPFLASEVFNCELSKLNDLFFSSRDELSSGD